MSDQSDSDAKLLRCHIDALFTFDSRGRLLNSNEPGDKPAPRFYLGKAAEASELRFRHDLPDDVGRRLSAAVQRGDDPSLIESILSRLAPVERSYRGPAFRFPDALADAGPTVMITAENVSLVHAHLPEWNDAPLLQPAVAALVDGHAVAVCCSVRRSAAAHEAGVETAPAFRKQGHAARAVLAWARVVRGQESIPLYSASWTNTASLALARKLGLRQYGTDLHVT